MWCPCPNGVMFWLWIDHLDSLESYFQLVVAERLSGVMPMSSWSHVFGSGLIILILYLTKPPSFWLLGDWKVWYPCLNGVIFWLWIDHLDSLESYFSSWLLGDFQLWCPCPHGVMYLALGWSYWFCISQNHPVSGCWETERCDIHVLMGSYFGSGLII